jgi:hypothetical protein
LAALLFRRRWPNDDQFHAMKITGFAVGSDGSTIHLRQALPWIRILGYGARHCVRR